MKRTIISMFACLTAVLFVSNLQAQSVKFPKLGSVNRFEKERDGLSSYEHLMLACMSDLYRNQTEESRAGNRSDYYLFYADSSQIYHMILREKDSADNHYNQYMPQKQNGKILSWNSDIAQYVLEELDKGNMVGVTGLGKRKFIVQSFNN